MSRLVVIPWRPAPSRIDAFERVVAWYERTLPEFEIRTLDTDDDLFALARIRNLAVTILDDPDDVVVINDADTFPDPEPLRSAVDAAAHGGQDERFRGWGFEDAAWYLAHETLLGAPPQRHDGRVYALNHDVETRAGDQYERNTLLMQRYRDAAGHPAAMAGLVAEAQAVRAAKARSGPGAAA